jgi:hypothetical protein
MDTSKPISLALAFHHCASTSSYWIWLAVVLAICLGGWVAILVSAKKKPEWDPNTVMLVWGVACLFAIAIAVFARPCDVAANTSVNMAAKGLWLGY